MKNIISEASGLSIGIVIAGACGMMTFFSVVVAVQVTDARIEARVETKFTEVDKKFDYRREEILKLQDDMSTVKSDVAFIRGKMEGK